MALTVETGAVVPGADSYADLATVDAYHAARGHSAWAEGAEAAREAAVRRAMGHLECLAWRGRPVVGPVGAAGRQPLQWPRYDVVRGGIAWPSTEIPPGVVYALCEAALRELAEPGALTPDLERGGLVIREKVDVIETEYAPGAPAGNAYLAVTRHLVGLVRSGGGSVELVRV